MKKKEKILIASILVLMVVAIAGVSYAAYKYIGEGSKVNTITTGAISMKYTESSNIINLNGALPTTDKTGMVRLNEGEYFDFTIESTVLGDVNINYEISAKDVTTLEPKIDGSNIKLYLTKLNSDGSEEALMDPRVYTEEAESNTYTGRPVGEMSLYTSNMTSSESNNYRLRMYVTEEYNPQGDGGNLNFSIQINVYGLDGPMITNLNKAILKNLGTNGSTYDDGIDTFITGKEPNNYIWYSGALWRAVSVNNETKTTKLVTQWVISASNYCDSSKSAFKGSYIEMWLNDKTADGFLGNLRDYENFIVTDAKWNATEIDESLDNMTRPKETKMVTDAVGLLNLYEYQTSYRGTTNTNGYLKNGLRWWSITPSTYTGYGRSAKGIQNDGSLFGASVSEHYGVRPSINLKSDVQIVGGAGTINNPYRLIGDNDKDIEGTKLSSRYSGEYLRFGTGENNLYRIVSHETKGLTKITSAEPLKDSGTFKTIAFGNNANYSSTNTIGTFLNGEYLINYVGSSYINMISDSTTWYLGEVGVTASYKLAKYKDINMSGLTSRTTKTKVGLLRTGELMAGQFTKSGLSNYWILTPSSTYYDNIRYIKSNSQSYGTGGVSNNYAIKPALNLKSNVIITYGEGTKEKPFEITLGS